MKAVVYQGPHRVAVASDHPEPTVRRPRDAVVRVTRTAICGSDLHPYRGEIPGFAAGTVLGHEFVGVVVDAGAEVPFRPGTRVFASDVVACGRCHWCAKGMHYHCPESTLFGYSTVVGAALDGGQAEYVLVPFADTVLAACPDEVPDEQMLFVGDLLSTAYSAAVAAVRPGEPAVVVGGGALGLLSALCAKTFGASEVLVADPEPARLALAEQLGFAWAGPDSTAPAVIEAVGTDAALARAIDAADRRGTVVAVGAHSSAAMPLNTQRAFTRELTLRFAVGDPIRDRDPVIALLRAGRIDPAVVISDRLPLSDAAAGYQRFDRRQALKVVLLPD